MAMVFSQFHGDMVMPLDTGLIRAPPTAPDTASPELEALRAMWPDVETEVLADLLAFHKDVDKVVDMLLDADASDDVELARRLQTEQDAEVATALHASLQAELQAEAASEAEAKRQQELPQAAARVMNSASTRAKNFLLQRRRNRPSETSTHEVRLLDAPLESGTTPATYDMTPLQVPAYVPPAAPSEATHPPVTDATPPRTTTEAALYNSRLDRARSANRVRQQSRLSLAAPESSAGSTGSPRAIGHVPEGQLI